MWPLIPHFSSLRIIRCFGAPGGSGLFGKMSENTLGYMSWYFLLSLSASNWEIGELANEVILEELVMVLQYNPGLPEYDLLTLGQKLGHIGCSHGSSSTLRSSSSTLLTGIKTSPLAMSTRIFSHVRNGIPKMALMVFSRATVNITGFVDVQDLEGIVIFEMSFLLTITLFRVIGW